MAAVYPQLGWQQKIRNSIMRIRTLFPYTIAPLIVHMKNEIRLFHEAIDFVEEIASGL